MAFTRFNDDDARIRKKLEVMTFAGRYRLDEPGNGMDLPFFADPQIRLQRWGANLGTNTTNLESDLLGLSRKYTRDDPLLNDYRRHAAVTQPAVPPGSCATENPFVSESRTVMPAWTFREMQVPRWETPWLNPQAHTEKDFLDNVQTRILEKDYFQRKV